MAPPNPPTEYSNSNSSFQCFLSLLFDSLKVIFNQTIIFFYFSNDVGEIVRYYSCSLKLRSDAIPYRCRNFFQWFHIIRAMQFFSLVKIIERKCWSLDNSIKVLVLDFLNYGVTYRSKFSQGIVLIEKSISMSEINQNGPLLQAYF